MWSMTGRSQSAWEPCGQRITWGHQEQQHLLNAFFPAGRAGQWDVLEWARTGVSRTDCLRQAAGCWVAMGRHLWELCQAWPCTSRCPRDPSKLWSSIVTDARDFTSYCLVVSCASSLRWDLVPWMPDFPQNLINSTLTSLTIPDCCCERWKCWRLMTQLTAIIAFDQHTPKLQWSSLVAGPTGGDTFPLCYLLLFFLPFPYLFS